MSMSVLRTARTGLLARTFKSPPVFVNQTRAFADPPPGLPIPPGLLKPDGKWAIYYDRTRGSPSSPPQAAVKRSFYFETMEKAWTFIEQVNALAKEHNHHPYWSSIYEQVVMKWSTRNPPGLTEKDLEMAKICDIIGAECGEVGPPPEVLERQAKSKAEREERYKKYQERVKRQAEAEPETKPEPK